MPEITCPCGNQFHAPNSSIARGGGKYCSQPCYRLFAAPQRGEGRAGWKGDSVGYKALHDWIRRERGVPLQCEACGAVGRHIEWANRSHEYRRDVDDWLALCKPCHCRHDWPTCRRGHERTPENVWIDKQGYPHCRPCRNERLRSQRRGQRSAWDAEKRNRQRVTREKFGASGSVRMGGEVRNE